jgi:hypothetical protein
MNPRPRAEPRWMSLGDLMVAVAGCAVGYVLQPFSPGWVQSGDLYGNDFYEHGSIFWTFRTPLLIVGFAMAAVVLARLARYRRMPRPAEWPALVAAATVVSSGVLDHTDVLGSAGWMLNRQWRDWHDQGLWPELILFGFPIAAGLRDRIRSGRRPWIWTEWVGLAAGLVLAACWSLEEFAPSDPTNRDHLANLFVRGLWLGVIGMASWLMLHGCDAIRSRSTPGARSARS